VTGDHERPVPCLHPTCNRRVPRAPGVCRAHYFALPQSLRGELDAAWQAVTEAKPLASPGDRPPVRQFKIDQRRLLAAQAACLEVWEHEPPPNPVRNLIRQERTGQVHVRAGSITRSRGRRIALARCGWIIAGVPYEGRLSDATCPRCKEEP
jgi:hypothetical protein